VRDGGQFLDAINQDRREGFEGYGKEVRQGAWERSLLRFHKQEEEREQGLA